MRQPAIVFTEYRDTLERLRDVLTAAGHPVAVLHGGMTPAERSVVQDAFNEVRLKPAATDAQQVRLKPDATDIKPDTTEVLLATDAASEGLNLQRRCRRSSTTSCPGARRGWSSGRAASIGSASPAVSTKSCWSPATRRNGWFWRRLRSARRARGSAMPGASRLVDAIAESRVASAVMDGEPIVHLDRQPDIMPTIAPAGLVTRESRMRGSTLAIAAGMDRGIGPP